MPQPPELINFPAGRRPPAEPGPYQHVTSVSRSAEDDRPECMVFLGLLPPYTLEDVQKAYKARALTSHPDRGGSPADFRKLQEAYDQAQDYVKFREGRRQWLAAQVEPYLGQLEVAAEIDRRGGEVEVDSVEWMNRSFGDFATLTERLKGVRYRDRDDADSLLSYLGANAKHLRYLIELDLTGSRVTDAGLAALAALRSLQRVNLSRTAITKAGIQALFELPDLAWVNVAGTSVGMWARRSLRKKFPDVEIVTEKA